MVTVFVCRYDGSVFHMQIFPCSCRKVEDLQFRVEEDSITKGDLEVRHTCLVQVRGG